MLAGLRFDVQSAFGSIASGALQSDDREKQADCFAFVIKKMDFLLAC